MHSLGYWSFQNVVIDLSSGQRPNISVAGEDSIDAVLPNSLGKNDFTTAFGVRFVEFSGGIEDLCCAGAHFIQIPS